MSLLALFSSLNLFYYCSPHCCYLWERIVIRVSIPFYPAERENLGKAPLNVFHRGSRSQIGGIRRCSRDTPCCLGTLRYLNCRSICARAHEHTYVHGNTRIQPLTHRRLYRNRFQSSVVRQIVIKKDQRASQKSQPCCNRHYSFPI